MSQKKHIVIKDYLGFHRKDFLDDHSLESKVYLATFDLYSDYVRIFISKMVGFFGRKRILVGLFCLLAKHSLHRVAANGIEEPP